MKFDHLSKLIPHAINADIEEYQKTSFASNNEPVEQWLMFEKEKIDLRF